MISKDLGECAMSSDISVNWSRFYQYQSAVRKRFGPHWRLPLARRHTDVAAKRLESGMSVLEVGAYDRNILRKIDLEGKDIDYRSLDTDRSLPHDYASIDEVDRTFDLIWMFEVIEHLPLADAADLVARIRDILVPGGALVLSTPNSHHPHRFREPHHITPFKYDNLGALLEYCGLELRTVYRLYNAPFFQKIAHRYVLQWLHRFLDIDFAPTLLAVASR